MSSYSIRMGESLGAIVNENGVAVIVTNDGDTVGVLSAEEIERFTSAYGDHKWRTAPLNESSVASMIQNLAGDGLLELRSVLRTNAGYALRLRMKRWTGVMWTVRNWGEWYRAEEESRLETMRRS